MKPISRNICIIVTLVTGLLLVTSGQASTMIDGMAVAKPGFKNKVGSTVNLPDIPNAIKYYIPLNGPFDGFTGNHTGIYGVAGPPSPCANGAGTCQDYGRGTGYMDADALFMNLFFDMTGLPESKSAKLSFVFDDLDLTPDNDPIHFYESISLSYWNWNTINDSFDPLTVDLSGGTIFDAAALPDSNQFPLDPNLITLDLNFAALGALNASAQSANQGFWIQLGFGSEYRGHYKKVWNTPEYLAAKLHVSPVPVPAAFWLFGTALIGFVGISRRRRLT